MTNLHNTPHGAMFHHFHGKNYSASQGSIDADEFKRLITYLSQTKNLLSASEFHERHLMGALENGDTCLTFDDALRCQYDVAMPILDELDLNAFFFIYTSIFTQNPDYLEIYRCFRHKCFANVNEFYDIFLDTFLSVSGLRRINIVRNLKILII